MEQTVNIEKFWRIIKKRKFAIVISALLGLIMSMLLIAFVLVPKYESQAQLIVTLPKNETADILSSKVDGTIMVVSEKLTKKANFRIAKHLLELVNANILGVVYNASKEDENQGYYYYGS